MAKGKSGLFASSKAIDPTLDALFSQSAGAVKTPPKSRYSELLPKRAKGEPQEPEEEDEEQDASEDEEVEDVEDESKNEPDAASEEGGSEDEETSSTDDESEAEEADDASSVDDEAEAAEVLERAVPRGTTHEEGRKRKRKQRDEDEDLEANYLERLADEEEPSGKRHKAESKRDAAKKDGADKTAEEDDEEDTTMKEDGEPSEDEVPVHESLKTNPAAAELEKANRTVFLSNVSVEAVTSRKAKKILLNHLSSVLDKKADPPQKVQSIRFRSTAFSTSGIPKRAAYIKKSVMEATTKSTNAYVVYTTTAAARLATSQLNGTVVLDRHLRVDSVAHPAPVDHRRCVFVGNLGFVDDETVYNTKLDEEGKDVTEKRKRTKTPMDVEEGLWRVFGKEAGKVESVRVVRDAATRVGKGFAYVQFYDGNAVESAILLNGKKFPPMLPRELRVSRCKAPHKTARAMEARKERAAMSSSDRKGGKHDKPKKGKKSDDNDTGKYVPKLTAEEQTLAGRASKLLGRFAAEKLVGGDKDGKKKKHRDRRNRGMGKDGAVAPAGGAAGVEKNAGFKRPEQFIFEGKRASARDGKPKDLKFKTRGKGRAKGPR
ncbi:hypothetical protein VTI74DRAFT_8255 [Chaetomium olivicolor]